MRISASEIDMKEKKNSKQLDDLYQNDYHKISFEDISKRFNVSLTNGLTSEYAASLLLKNGKNLLRQEKKNIFTKLFSYLFTGFCGVLWIAAVICILAWKPIGNPPDPTNLGLGIILVIVILLQAAFSAFQDWSSNKVMNSIKNMMPSSAQVIRNGIEQKIYAEDLVVGDLVLLSYGYKVPADIRLIESHDLKFDKSMLTGESEAIESSVSCTDKIYTESKNIAFMTTLITNGQGKGVVVEVGDRTMIGKIAKLTTETKDRETSLQKEIKRFVIFIVAIAISTVIVLLIVWATWLRIQYPTYIDTPTMMVNVIAVLVAFIPTGLPVAVTLSLLLMAKKMAKHKVLVKNLTTIETLSCVNVIASDKTGTLTQNKMFVASASAGMKIVDIKIKDDHLSYKQLVASSLLCNNASFITSPSNENKIPVNQRQAKGDATDVALLRFGTENIHNSNIIENYTELVEIPFNSKNKWMMKFFSPKDNQLNSEVFSSNQNQNIMLLKGAPDILLMKCKTIVQEDGSEVLLDPANKFNLIKIQNDWCMLGQRVLLLCKKNYSIETSNEICLKNTHEIENYVSSQDDFCLIGMIGIIDPPREGMSDVIAKCKGAGIKVLMVTGDYALTAAAIASEIGIFTSKNYDTSETVRDKMKSKKIEDEFTNSSQVTSLLLNGAEIELLSDENWRTITKYDEIVLARTTPEQKLKTVNEFRKDGYIVAVTGDGVNDAPALKNADIGIAMGSGSEVAIEASQMVLLDNSFTSILIAIENGRLVFDNLRKVILYLLPAGSFAEVVPILVNIFLGVPLPLSAFLMICICILTDMFPALSLMLEKPENNLLKRPPRSKTDHLVDIKLIVQAYLFLGLMEAFFSHCLFFWYLEWYGGFKPSDILFGFDYWNSSYKGYTYEQVQEFIYTGQTITFIGLVIMQAFGNVFATRTSKLSIFQQSPFHKESRNVWILAAQFITIVSMVLIVYLPICNSVFNTRPPPIEFWFIPLIFAVVILVADELRKLMVRNKFLCFPKFAW